ncbi:chemotaxis protein CheA [Nitrospirota bacterium]
MSRHDEHIKVFIEEAEELLEQLEQALLELEEAPGDKEAVGLAFRSIHTIKGSSSMFGLTGISSLAHEVEALFECVRNGDIAVTMSMIDISLAATDQLRLMIEAHINGEEADQIQASGVIQSLRGILTESGGMSPPPIFSSDSAHISGSIQPDTEGEAQVFQIRFKPPENIYLRGLDPNNLVKEIYGLGHCHVSIDGADIPPLEDLNPEHCYATWNMILTTKQGINAIKDVFIFVQEDSDLTIEEITSDTICPETIKDMKIGEILVMRGDINKADLDSVLEKQKSIGEMIVDEGLVELDQVESALQEQKLIKEACDKSTDKQKSSTIRVPAEKLDDLVNLVGEMVTVQESLRETTSDWDDLDLLGDSSEKSLVENARLHRLIRISRKMERLVGDIKDNTMSIRMLPVSVTFNHFRRLVRDLSKNLSKEVEFVTSGGKTELDKTVIEMLDSPLVHIIRNCIDHGIETPSVREAEGKSRQGMVHLSAEHSGAHVLIHIKDDGMGIDTESVKAKALQKGLISRETELTDEEIYSLLFAPGFSTAKEVTDVSGRGVGMDVVKRSIDALGGSVSVKSKKGTGTEISLKLPLTLAIIDGLLVTIDDGFFIVPLSTVEQCVELTREDVASTHGRDHIEVMGHIIPYIPLRKTLCLGGTTPDIEQVVISGSNGRRVGFVVDNVIGEYQTVIKSLGGFYRNQENISGASILGDGTVALILDTNKLASFVETLEPR